ncbi:MAG: CRTAC1 family protein [Acidimicrobiia bacterium]|nr:CRTAC1 family protein [Acidimicrobiia bacterium]
MHGRRSAARQWALGSRAAKFGLTRTFSWIWLPALLLVATACTGGDDEVNAKVDEGPPALVDVAAEVGLDFEHGAFRWGASPDPAAMMGTGLCWLDYNDDGWLDLFVVNSFAQVEAARWREQGGLPTTALFRNEEGTFTDVTAATGAGLPIRGAGCVAADLDLDGDTDLYVTSERVNQLLWNDGEGGFVEGAADAGVATSGWQTGAAVGDLNDDGWPDLVVAGYADTNYRNPDASEGFPDTFLGVRDLLYLSNGRGDDGAVTFREVGAEAGLEARTEKGGYEYGLGVMVLDVDGDNDLDVFVANDTNPNRLYGNVAWPGGAAADPLGLGFRFEDISASSGLDDDRAGMGVALGDYDRNEVSDFFVTNSRDQGHGVFRDVSIPEDRPSFEDDTTSFGELEAYTGWGVSWLDLDLDADLDLVVANGDIPITDLAADAMPIQAFTNVSETGARFENVSESIGLADIGRIHGRGSAAADYDNDGDVDVAVNAVAGRLILLENRGVSGNWLQVELERSLPGAVVAVTLPDGRRLVRHALAGSSYLSTEDPRVHVGLADVASVPEVTVTWPGGETTRLSDVEVNRIISVKAPD